MAGYSVNYLFFYFFSWVLLVELIELAI